MIIETLERLTQNFNSFNGTCTLMGWIPRFDDKGRPLNADPNVRRGNAHVGGIDFHYVRVGWKVTIYEDSPSKGIVFRKLDLTPEYLKDGCGVDRESTFELKGFSNGKLVTEKKTNNRNDIEHTFVGFKLDEVKVSSTIKTVDDLDALIRSMQMTRLCLSTTRDKKYSVNVSDCHICGKEKHAHFLKCKWCR